MKRGQVRSETIVLAVVLLIALGGILFLLGTSGLAAYGVSEVYRGGIAQVTELPRYVPGGPEPQFPAGAENTVGSRTPLVIMFKGEFRNIKEMSVCWNDLAFKIPAPQDAFSCYSVPTTGPSREVTGWFWPDNSAAPRPLYQLGGDVYCYENTPYDREQLMDRIYEIGKEKGWAYGKMNNEDVVLCLKGERFLFPQ
ncbi:hypothetical protein C4580_00850 [Candidatus Woesearchaeota archaeon]|nr:MAG: hypothetical protein C4580_00850 [Candidatus Woesearchaeota archaeon]